MRKIILLLFSLLLSHVLFAQMDYSIRNEIERNYNMLADGLKQDLSVSKDSLVLVNEKLFSKIRFFNDTFDETFYFKPAVKKGMISLNELPLGSYTVMFYQSDMTIVLRVHRKSKFNNVMERLSAVAADNGIIESDISFEAPIHADSDNDIAINDEDDLSWLVDDSPKKKLKRQKNDGNLEYDAVPDKLNLFAKSKFTQLEEGKMHTYNLTVRDRDHVQTREEYRRTHLRPNGKPYD
ncbi:MAG: hypothetical protein AAF688_07765 [Bacteroidota bacterium]